MQLCGWVTEVSAVAPVCPAICSDLPRAALVCFAWLAARFQLHGCWFLQALSTGASMTALFSEWRDVRPNANQKLDYTATGDCPRKTMRAYSISDTFHRRRRLASY